MSKLLMVFACVALFQIATALKCYQCDKESCKEKSTWKEQTCGPAIAPMEAACVTHTYKDASDQKEYVDRKCIQINPKEDYKCSPNLGAEVSCKTCTTELCNTNSASSISLSFVAISGVLLALFAQKFYL